MPCRDFRAEQIPGHGSIGDWAACDECKALIEADQRDALARRWLARDPDARVLPEAIAMEAIRYLHDKFFENRCGEPFLADDQYMEDTRDPAA